MNVDFSVTKNGKELDKRLYTWDEDSKTFSTFEDVLVLDFRGVNGCTFKTGHGCTFKTGYDCTFKTGHDCVFKTGHDCTFKTGHDCTFKTGYNCTFKTGYNCTFKTGFGCTFNTGFGCTFNTGHDCTFDVGGGCTLDTGDRCTFDTGGSCTFKTGKNCVVVRRDIFEVIELEESVKIKLNGTGCKGYNIVRDGRDIIFKDGDYIPDIDILIRVYANQTSFCEDEDLFAGEVLFKPHIGYEHQRFTAPFPRGLVEGIKEVLDDVKGNWKIQVSNELSDVVRHLTSCREHFNIRFKRMIND
jgi:hypothetical protein